MFRKEKKNLIFNFINDSLLCHIYIFFYRTKETWNFDTRERK